VGTGVQKSSKRKGYEERPFMEEFKRGMNETICQRLMKSKRQLASIEQWYERAIALDRS